MTTHRLRAERFSQLPNTARASASTSMPGDSVLLQVGVLQEVIRALACALASHSPESMAAADPAVAKPLLDLDETAELLGVSRMTVARMADEGRLPSVVVRRGRVQKIRRIPRAFVDKVVADAAAGAQVDLEEYTAAWLTRQSKVLPLASAKGNKEPEEGT